MKQINVLLLLIMSGFSMKAQRQIVATFDNLELPSIDTFWNGSDSSGAFIASGYTFKNSYNSQWKSWSGWAYSNQTDSSTAGYGNQYSCYDVSGLNGTKNFAVSSNDATVVLPKKMTISGTYVTNAAYAAQSMLHGDGFAKKFGGTDGNEKDWFLLKAYGYAGGSIKDSASIYLADFRFDDNSKDYIINKWTWFDLKSIGEVDSFIFALSSSDVGQHGMNTPASFCLDGFNGLDDSRALYGANFNEFQLANDSFYNGSDGAGGFVSGNAFFVNNYNTKWKSWSGWAVSDMRDTMDKSIANQYSAFSAPHMGGGYHAVGFGEASIQFGFGNTPTPATTGDPNIMLVSNTVFGHEAIKNGTQFSKKFGGPTGNDPDYFIVNFVGIDYDGNAMDTVSVVLADYRFNDNTKDYILDEWSVVDISSLTNSTRIVRIDCFFESSDTGQYGINTPKYFALGDFNNIISGVSQIEEEELLLFPNPAANTVNFVNFEGDCEVFDVQGRRQEVRSTKTTLDVSGLKPGIYFVHGLADGKIHQSKFIKQ